MAAQAATTIPAMLREAAARHGDRPAIVDGDVTLSYHALAGAAARAAGGLRALGVRPRDRVALWASNGWPWIVAALGTHLAGAALVPINTRFKDREAAFILERSGARVLFTDRDTALAAPHIVRLPWTTFEGAPFEADVAPDDLSDVMFTSGTTGHPKAVPGTHAQALRAYAEWARLVGLREGDRYLVVVPFFHTFGYKAGFLAALLSGATIYPHAIFEAGEVMARVARERITVLPGPPTLYQTLLAHPELAAHDLSSLRLAVTGAAVIPVELVERMRRELGFATVITGYGLTEATGIVTMCREGDDAETIATTSGRAIPGVEVKLAEDGEILVRGYNVMKGYLDDPAATAEAIDPEGWLRTGDLGALDARGYLRITDRKKDMFIVGGFNAYPAEIEHVLCAHAAVAQAAVVGAPDARLGEVGVAYLVSRPGVTADPDEILRFCRDRMAGYKVPRRIEILDALPLNATGKVSKLALRERARRS